MPGPLTVEDLGKRRREGNRWLNDKDASCKKVKLTAWSDFARRGKQTKKHNPSQEAGVDWKVLVMLYPLQEVAAIRTYLH